MDRGDLVSDEIVVGIIAERLGQARLRQGCGVRRVPAHDRAGRGARQNARGAGTQIDAVIELKVDDEAMVGRMETPVKENPGSARPDDNPGDSAQPIAGLSPQYGALLEFYRRQGKLTSVDGMAPIPQVAAAIALRWSGSQPARCPKPLRTLDFIRNLQALTNG
jgi:adenylate kinase